MPGRALLLGGIGLTIVFDVLALKGGDIAVLGFLFAPHGFSIFGHKVHAAYALLPWFAVAMAGVGLGPWLSRAKPRVLAMVGLAMVMLSMGLRSVQLGDPSPWSNQPRGSLYTVLDFINPSKYPPSLCFLLLTLGAAMLLLAGPLRRTGPINGWLSMFGRVPLMFYLLHLPLAHALGNAWAWTMHDAARVPHDTPLSMGVILGSWAAVVLLLWPVCAYWRRLKDRRPDLKWLAYL